MNERLEMHEVADIHYALYADFSHRPSRCRIIIDI